jgi:glycosyltransferase involved in cell wall biosynthesis
MISIIIPARNEEKTINFVLDEISKLKSEIDAYEVIVVNDGSDDRTGVLLSARDDCQQIKHPYSKGNGSAIKAGVNQAKGEIIVTLDADNQHKPGDIKKLLEIYNEYGGLVTGARINYNGPAIRIPGKYFLQKFASYIIGQKINDINCGFRVYSKTLFLKYCHLFPNGFSLLTTMLLCCLKDGVTVSYVPIEVNKRQGRSFVSPKDAFALLLQIFRITVLFSPMRVFGPLAFVFMLVGGSLATYDLFGARVSNSASLFLISSIILFCFGLIIDQLSSIRRNLK